jgi:fatty-acyl-CoA synthase
MMGAVLQTVNWRLSVDQLGYTLNHAQAKLIIIHADFLPMLATIRNYLDRVKTIVAIKEDDIKRIFNLTSPKKG